MKPQSLSIEESYNPDEVVFPLRSDLWGKIWIEIGWRQTKLFHKSKKKGIVPSLKIKLSQGGSEMEIEIRYCTM